MRKNFALVGCMAVLLASPALAANEGWSDYTIPGWLERTDVTIYADDDVVRVEGETIQPLYQDVMNTFFTQGRFSGLWGDGPIEDDWTMNVGFGYRYLTPDKSSIFGINAFYDLTGNYNHQRVGLGVEWMHSYTTVRANVYLALTDWKTVSTSGATTIQEQALDGFDAEVETLVPYMPWLRFRAGGYYWDADANEDIRGARLSFVGELNDYAKVEVGASMDNYDDKIWAKLTVSLGPRTNVDFTAQNNFISSEALPARDLTIHTLDKVERQNEVVTERRGVSAGGTTSGGVFIRGS